MQNNMTRYERLTTGIRIKSAITLDEFDTDLLLFKAMPSVEDDLAWLEIARDLIDKEIKIEKGGKNGGS